jgi:hypothetical protein
MRLTDEIDRRILAAVCDDFTILECILDKVSGDVSGSLDRADLQNRLLRLVSDKLINAYLLHAEPPFMTRVQINSDDIQNSWFFIAQRGRKCLSNSSPKYRRTRRGGANPPDKSDYTPAVNL